MTDHPARSAEVPEWMGDIDPSQIGFPFKPDKSRYTKRIEIPYKETPLGPLYLDAYRPRDAEVSPLVVMIHGGGWRQGGRFEMGISRWAGYLASHGLAVASIDYRLAPGTSYPDSFQDCIDAIDWCVEHAGELGADASRVGLWGDSAGGHLVLLVAASQTRPDFAGPRLRCGGERLAGVVAWYPPTDMLRLHNAEGRRAMLGANTVRDFVGVAPEQDPQRWRDASPLEQAHAAMPPALILHGTRDLLVSHHHTVDFGKRLEELGVPHELHIVENAVHGFERVAPDDRAKHLIERTRDYLREKLGS